MDQLTETDREYGNSFRREISKFNPEEKDTEEKKKFNQDYEKTLKGSVNSERAAFNPFKEIKLPEKKYKEDNVRSTSTEKYAYYSRHSFNVNNKVYSFLSIL